MRSPALDVLGHWRGRRRGRGVGVAVGRRQGHRALQLFCMGI